MIKLLIFEICSNDNLRVSSEICDNNLYFLILDFVPCNWVTNVCKSSIEVVFV